jgi:hypothetical protein
LSAEVLERRVEPTAIALAIAVPAAGTIREVFLVSGTEFRRNYRVDRNQRFAFQRHGSSKFSSIGSYLASAGVIAMNPVDLFDKIGEISFYRDEVFPGTYAAIVPLTVPQCAIDFKDAAAQMEAYQEVAPSV